MTLHTLEARSARVSAVLDARPELGALWRRLVSISEASAALSMEDIPVPEQDIVMVETGSSLTKGDPQAARIARDIHKFLLRPGDLLQDPGDVFDRAIQTGRLNDIIDQEDGGRVPHLTSDEKLDWLDAKDDFIQMSARILNHKAPIIFRLIALSSLTSQILPSRMPISERLIFVAAESALRRRACLSDTIVGSVLHETDQRISAHWTLTPSIALSRGGFRAWSPASESGRKTLGERLDTSLGNNVGQLGSLNKWMGDMSAFSGQTRRSKKKEVADLFMRNPILGASHISESLGITSRAARTLIDDAEARGLVSLITPRRSYRLWAVPFLADMLRNRPEARGALRANKEVFDEMGRTDVKRADRSPEELDEAMEIATKSLDDAIAKADLILARYATTGNEE